MNIVAETSWWLDCSALPDRLLWARLHVFQDGAAEVFDVDGKYHRFAERRMAERWLAEDEYSSHFKLVEDGEIDAEVAPPDGGDDSALLRLMQGHRSNL